MEIIYHKVHSKPIINLKKSKFSQKYHQPSIYYASIFVIISLVKKIVLLSDKNNFTIVEKTPGKMLNVFVTFVIGILGNLLNVFVTWLLVTRVNFLMLLYLFNW